jgi:hypothetical protein
MNASGSGRGGGNDQGQGIKPSLDAEQPSGPGDQIGELVDWQMRDAPDVDGWTCPNCQMNWTEQPMQCPCVNPEPGQPNAATLELCFWEAVKRCVLDDEVPMAVELDCNSDRTGIELPNPIPPKLWKYMAAAHAELRTAAEV